MSHFSTLKVSIKNRALAVKVAQQLGWTCEHADVYENPWKLAKESIKDCTLFKDAHGRVKMAVDAKGNVIHDDWSMGKEAFGFLRDYSEAYIRKTASAEGAMVHSKGVDAQGNLVLELEYA